MYILAVETTTPNGSLALFHSEKKSLYFKSWSRKSSKDKAKNSHSDVLTLHFKNALDEFNIIPQEISVLLTTCGPGSFTGIRVALNFMKTLAYSLELPVYTIDTLFLMGLNIFYLNKNLTFKKDNNSQIICMNNAQKNSVFFSKYQINNSEHILNNNKSIKEDDSAGENESVGDFFTTLKTPCLLGLNDLEKHITNTAFCLGDAFEIYKNHLPEKVNPLIQPLDYEFSIPSAQHLVQFYSKSPKSFKKSTWLDLLPLYLKGSEAEENLRKGLLKPLPKF